jgi:hypothetical protein
MVRLFQLCDKGMSGIDFPDGKPVLEQPIVLIEAWGTISRGLADARKDKQ